MLNDIQKDTVIDRCYGCILGSFIADSIGSYHEFAENRISEQDMDTCFTMPGGGYWEVGPGQPTDDTELAFSMMQGIVEGNDGKDKKSLPLKAIAKSYGKWIMSPPFDIGQTTKQALT